MRGIADGGRVIAVAASCGIPTRNPSTPNCCARPGCCPGSTIEVAKAKATIPVPADQAGHRRNRGSAGGRPPAFDPVLYRDHNVVERGINQLKQHRAVATRYDKLAVRYLATIHIAAINQWLRHE